MRSLFRHIVATVIVVPIFALASSADGFHHMAQHSPHANPGLSLAATGMMNFMIVAALSLVVLTPVAAIAEYLFTFRWPIPFYGQLPVLILFLGLYLVPWTLLFGRHALIVLFSGLVGLTIPLLLYWAVYRGLDRDFSS